MRGIHVLYLLPLAFIPLVAVGTILLARQALSPKLAAQTKETPKEEPKVTTPVAVLPTTPKDTFAEVSPLFTKYCITCHNDKKQAAGLSLEPFKNDAGARKAVSTWELVKEHLETKQMPPKGKPQPTDAERKTLLTWLERINVKIDCGLARDPGRPTIRRLNRQEYNNTIRDLVGVDFKPADDFPSDDVGYGFDNIGDVLSMSPLLLEKYLRAAEQIADKAIVLSGKRTFDIESIATDMKVIEAAPDIIIGSWCGKKFRPENVAARAGWQAVNAVRHGQLFEIKSCDILQPGPAALTDGVGQLHAIVTRWMDADQSGALR